MPAHERQMRSLPLLAGARRHSMKLLLGLAIAIYAGVSLLILGGIDGLAALRLRLDPSPFLNASAILQIHITAALGSFLIGCFLLAGGKGGTRHRVLGYGWIVLMTATAASSFFLTEINPGRYSFIHAISAWTLVILPMGLAAARRRNIAAHRRHMTGLFIGGMAIAGLFTFLPGRLMWTLFFAA